MRAYSLRTTCWTSCVPALPMSSRSSSSSMAGSLPPEMWRRWPRRPGSGSTGAACWRGRSGAAAHLQVFGGLRELAWGCEHFGPQILVDDLVEQPLRFADFRIHLPAGPGLGVTLDQEKLRRYARG